MQSRAPLTWSSPTRNWRSAAPRGSRARRAPPRAISGNTHKQWVLHGRGPSPIPAEPQKKKPMRTSNFILALVGVAFLGAGAAHALDAAPRPQPLTPALSPALAPATKYGSARDALRSGMRDYKIGRASWRERV